MKRKQEYEKDFYAWAIHNAQLLREGKLAEIDIENIAEEIESMGKSEKRELVNRLAVLITHLLKWQFQPERRSNSWKYTIEEQRDEVLELLEESPSLKKELEAKFIHAYEKALILASEETSIDESEFPKKPPFNLKNCLSNTFLPD